ncbi:MAG: APHP domain-containing protein, partial [Hydrococcus sp. RM1_1_31]|nr:APHP domain-containing protein [Hydrococcus sp. RM1_1_31]
MSSDPFLDDEDRYLDEVYVEGSLAAGESYTKSRAIDLYTGGGYGGEIIDPNLDGYLLVVSDASNYQSEQNENNNVKAIPFEIKAPNLTLTDATVPAIVSGGEEIEVSWTVVNNGETTTARNWIDRVYLSDNPNFDGRYNFDGWYTELASYEHSTPLAVGESYTATNRLAIPNLESDRSYYLIVITNAGQYEDGAWRVHGETSRADNLKVIPINTGTQGANLVISDVMAPAIAGVGGDIEVTWTVTNTGNLDAVFDWRDYFYLSDDENYSDDDTLFSSQDTGQATPIAPGESYTFTRKLNFPNTKLGNRYLIVRTNGDKQQPETDETDNFFALPIEIKAPNLVISDVLVPETVTPGERVTVSWTVKNQGEVAATADWYDNIILSSDRVYDRDFDTLLVRQWTGGNTPLAPGASYTFSYDLTIPNNIDTGNFYLLFRADEYGSQLETNETDNLRAVSINVNATDLTVSAPNAPTSIKLGETANISWTVTNIGIGRATANWSDVVYLSSDQILDASDLFLSSSTTQTPLEAGKSYTAEQNIIFPGNMATGNYYLLFTTDRNNNQKESNENNNIIARSVELTAPNLSVSSISIPNASIAQSGQSLAVNWTVNNTGTVIATGSWSDRIYLSADGTLNNSIFLKAIARTQPIAVGESYTTSTDIVLPDVVDGNYRLLVVTDANNQLIESSTGETNNQSTSATFAIGHPDLVAAITPPSKIISGSTIPLTWTITNTGTAPTLNSWSDRIYLSTDSTFDARDTLLGQFIHNSPLAIGAIAQGNINWNIPLELSGNYHLLIVTDAEKAVKELNAEDNNITASAIRIELAPYADLAVSSVTAPPLTIGDPATVEIGWQVTNLGTGRGRT